MAYAVSAIVHAVEDAVFGNKIAKKLDPLSYAINQNVQENVAPIEEAGASLLIPKPPQQENLGGTPAVAEETSAAGKKKAQRDLNRRRQGSGASGSTLITGDEDQMLEKSTLLGL